MRSSTAFFFTLLLIFFVAEQLNARKEPEEYWKSATNGEAMPKAIKDLVVDQNKLSDADSKSHFVKDFDPNSVSVNIIYHKVDHQTNN